MSYRPESPYNPVPMPIAIECMALPDPDIEHLLGPTGPVAAAMGTAYQDRPQQRQLSQVIRRALKQRRDALTEGGCGTGKTSAYLAPAILHALENKQQVVISTHTTTLQDQLAEKDLPFLQRALKDWMEARFGRNFTWSILKGRQQSLCEAKWARLAEPEPYIQEWRETTEDGDLGGLALTGRQRAQLTATSEECPGSKCAFSDICWWLHSKQRAKRADIVVVTHALLVAGLQADPGMVLPTFDAIVVDEAHELAQVIREALGIRVSPGGVQQLVKQAEKFANTVAEGIPHELSRLLATLQHDRRDRADEGSALLDPDRDLRDTAAEEHLVELLEQVGQLSRAVAEVGDFHAEESEEWARSRKLMGSLDRLHTELTSLRIGRAGRVSWLELADGASLNAQPVDVSTWLRERTKAPIVLSSATLATGGSFDYISETLGIRSLHQKQVGSPFDWGQQAWIYLPEMRLEDLALGVKCPKKRAECNREYARVATLYAKEFFRYTKGRAIWLFTARSDMHLVAELLKADSRFHHPHLMQGEMGMSETLNWFRNTPGAVLLGLASLWQGLDIQGEALSALVIHKIPFPPPSDLVHEARVARAGGGRHAFQQLSVPYAVIRMNQGFGRLIRTCYDRGVAMLLDPRLRGKHAAILDALPPAKRIERKHLRHVPWHLAAAGEPVVGPHAVAEGLRRLGASGVPDAEHRAYIARMVERLPLLPPGLWKAGEWLCNLYQNVSKTIGGNAT